MKLPNGDKAIVEKAKLVDYALNPDHPVGGPHARLFKLLLGIDRDNWKVLEKALLNAAASEPALPGNPSVHGVKYEIRFMMTGLRGTYKILSVWIVPNESDVPHLVTAYIK